MDAGCVIMAAGRGVRFGGNKLLMPLAGAPLLSYVLRALSCERFARVVAVTSDEGVAGLCAQCGVHAVRYPGGPQSETVRRGIAQMADLDACMFVQGDQPLLTAASVIRLLDAQAAEPDDVHRLAFGAVPGSPVVFPARLFPALAALSGERGGMAAARATGARVRLVQALASDELADVDTMEALAAVERMLMR